MNQEFHKKYRIPRYEIMNLHELSTPFKKYRTLRHKLGITWKNTILRSKLRNPYELRIPYKLRVPRPKLRIPKKVIILTCKHRIQFKKKNSKM